MTEKTKNKIKNTCLFAGGIGFGVCLVGIAYEKMRKEHNNLVKKYNEHVDFINKHDFYTKSKKEDKDLTPKKSKLVKVGTEYDDETKEKKAIYKDLNTNLKFVVCY